MRTIPIILLTGYLGTGKTTLLNALLAQKRDLRLGVLVNEWGDVSVDAGLTDTAAADSVVEVNGGQIFCSCVSTSFVDGLARLAERDPDVILVEASGLTRPGSMDEVLAQAVERTLGKLRYGAVVCVVDAARHAFVAAPPFVPLEQISRSDFLVLTKTDLVNDESRAAAHASLARLRPDAPVLEVLHGALPEGSLDRILAHDAASAPAAPAGVIVPGWGAAGKPTRAGLQPSTPVSTPALRRFLEAIAPSVLRAKGCVEVADEPGQRALALAETAGPLVSVKPAHGETTPIVLIGGGAEARDIALAAWKRETGTEASLI